MATMNKTCAFCKTNSKDTKDRVFLSGPDNVSICSVCISKGKAVLDANNLPKVSIKKDKKNTPASMVATLDEFIINQNEAKKNLAVTVYNHYKKIQLAKQNKYVTKSNCLLIGPTGVGKTYLVSQLAELLEVPFTVVDTAQITPKGYKGDSVNDAWVRLFNKLGGDEAAAEKMTRSIVYFDEIDKLCNRGDSSSEARDFYSNVQNELLKVLESSSLTFTIDGKMGQVKEVTIDTTNMLFIFGGAFSGIEDIIEKRLGLSSKSEIGFTNSNSISKDDKLNLISKVTLDDIKEYGLSPEFIGRISNVVALNPLSIDDLVNILYKPKNSIISQYKDLFALDGVELVFEDEALKTIAEKAFEKKTGARALKSVIESSMMDLMYELPSKPKINQCRITKEFINGEAEAILTTKSNRKSSTKKALSLV